MKAGTKVRITKREESPDRVRPDMPVGYWVEGVLLRDLAVGKRVLLDRSIRNGIVIDGVFETSPVAMIHWRSPVEVMTANSVYFVEEVADATDKN